jgi:hypothetical protein
MKKLKVFISSPYTKGDQGENVRVQMDYFETLYKQGFIPFAPLLFHFQHMVHPLDYEEWMEIDLAMLNTCDIVLRLEGESSGADREVKEAIENNIKVVYSLIELYDYVKLMAFENEWDEK